MIRNSRRMVALAVAGAVAIAPVISGCGAGRQAQSAAPTQLTEGVNVSVPIDDTSPQILLRNMFVLGAKPGESVSQGASLPLYGTLINQVRGRQDRLVSVSSPQFASARFEGGPIDLPPAAPDGAGGVAQLLGEASPSPGPTGRTTEPGQQPGTTSPTPTGPGATSSPTASPTSQNTNDPQQGVSPAITGETQPRVILTGLNTELVAGSPVTIRMRFERAGAVEFQVPLVAQQGDYATYPAAPTPAAQTPSGQEPSPGTEPAQPGGTASPDGTATPTQNEGNASPGAGGH